MKNRILWGLLAGIIGGLAGAMILWGSWLLPSLGLLLTRADIINGISALLIFGAAGGILYALVVGERRLRLFNTILAGLLLGVILWVVGVLILIPVILGFPPQLTNPLDHWTPLLAFSFYGIIAALLYRPVGAAAAGAEDLSGPWAGHLSGHSGAGYAPRRRQHRSGGAGSAGGIPG